MYRRTVRRRVDARLAASVCQAWPGAARIRRRLRMYRADRVHAVWVLGLTAIVRAGCRGRYVPASIQVPVPPPRGWAAVAALADQPIRGRLDWAIREGCHTVSDDSLGRPVGDAAGRLPDSRGFKQHEAMQGPAGWVCLRGLDTWSRGVWVQVPGQLGS